MLFMHEVHGSHPSCIELFAERKALFLEKPNIDMPNLDLPNCTETGEYEPLQCNKATGEYMSKCLLKKNSNHS